MKKLLIVFMIAGTMTLAATTAYGALASISGTITPTNWTHPTYSWAVADFGYIADTANIVDAQSQGVIVSGTIGSLPENSDYWLEIGLVPKSIYESPDYTFFPYIFNKGVTAYTEYDGSDFEVGLLHTLKDPLAICVNPVSNDGSISFSFTLTPIGSAGGSGTMIVDGYTATYDGSTTLAYNQGLTESYLVGMVWVDSGSLDSVTVSAEANVPIPPAAILLASGLLGLVGIRRFRNRG
jgi:hypothetical protein